MVVETPVMEQVPIVMGEDRVIRLTGRRLQLETITLDFQEGHSPETIAQSYTVPLADIYQVLGYYLRHKNDVDEYVRQRLHEAEEWRKEIEARWLQDGVRERLLARWRAKQDAS